MNKIYFILAFLLFPFLAFAEPLPDNQAEKLATAMGIVYVGMPKEVLYQIYTPLTQKGYRKIDDEEWIAFSDWTTEEPGDVITFYLQDNKVKGWENTAKPQPVSAHNTISI